MTKKSQLDWHHLFPLGKKQFMSAKVTLQKTPSLCSLKLTQKRRLLYRYVLNLVLLSASFLTSAQTETAPVLTLPNKSTTNQTSNWGTGFVVDDGYVLTAFHVIQGQTQVLLGPITSGRWITAEVVKTDPKLDLALLKARIDLPALALATSNRIPHGLEVSVIGYPQPRTQGMSKKITQGIVNGYRTDIEQSLDIGFMQISAEVSPGNSGGPVLGPDGTVVGMIQRKLNSVKILEQTQSLQLNVNFALRSSAMIQFLQGSPANPKVHQLSTEIVLRPYQIYNQSQASILAVIARGALNEIKSP
jgi:S1-C subfamily serine protease